MAKYALEYGLINYDLKVDIESCNSYLDAVEKAQEKALEVFSTTEESKNIKERIYSEYGYDPFTAYAYYLSEALDYITFSIREIDDDKSVIYLVSNQPQLFGSKFKSISLNEAIKLLNSCSILGLDSETAGLDCHTKSLLLLQIGNKDFQVVFDIENYGGIIPEELVNFLNNYPETFIIQNAKFDLKFLFKQGVILKRVYDTMLAEIIITNGLQYEGRDLKSLAKKYCNVDLDKSVRGEIIKGGISDRVIEYGANDVKYLPEIREKQLIEIDKYHLKNAVNLDNTFVIVLAYVEYCGIKLDYEKWKKKVEKNIETAEKYRIELEDFIFKDGKLHYFSGMQDLFTGEQECIINWDSPKQVTALLKEYGVNTEIFKHGEKKESIDARTLEPQAKDFPIIAPYLKYKKAQKEVTTYGYNWKKYINPVTGRIHTTYTQLVDTGRLSSGSKRDDLPNMQNIPADEETRACFICEPGNILVDADYHSQEQIVLANFSKEPNLLNFYKQGFTDMHSYVAFLMYPNIRKCSLEELTPEKLTYIKPEYPEQRRIAKSAGFAINYGGNGNTIANNCNISKSEGDFVYKSYFNSFPMLKEYFDIGFRKAVKYGYIEYNDVTRRKYFFNTEENNYFKYKDIINDRFLLNEEDNPREVMSKFNIAKGEIQRLSQNYPIIEWDFIQ
jgi:DNA polymerase I-like protein with 3'-5' exonuclease and polymerase domains